MKVYNTLTREKEEFRPIGSEVGFYSCGPTVYWHPHIGNMRTYVFNDILKRVLLYNGFRVKHVMNYTDVGHLTSDADEGEDKIEKAAKKEKKTAQEIAEFYIKAFDDDARSLNILPPTVTCRATEYIKEQIELIEMLEKKGLTYKTEDGIYFETTKFADYAKLGRLNIEGLDSGHRTDVRGKKHKTDFALWKFSEVPGVRQQEWESPWGVGFPGWHTECVVMASAHLGEQFDIHTGGEDHIQVHHTNEIAQAESAYGKKPWVKYWMHGSYLNFEGEKISKSKGGLFTIPELAEKGFDPLVFRYFCLTAVYRKQTNFSLDALKSSQNALDKLRNTVLELREADGSQGSNEDYRKEFLNAINDDLNMPQALSVLWSGLRDSSLGSKQKLELALDFDSVFGLGLADLKQAVVPDSVQELAQEREQARKDKDWAKADELRDKIKSMGFVVADTPEGPKLTPIKE